MGVFAAQVAGMAQIACVVLLMGGEKVFQLFGAPTPEWYHSVAENKMMAFGAVWMANNMAAQMVATGAFEIYLDGQIAFSKLDAGRLPSAGDVVRGMEKLGLTTTEKGRYVDDEF